MDKPNPSELRHDVLWGQLHALTVIAQLGSFTKAAQRLGLSKAAVSQRISELERAMGQSLVSRTTRSVRLSEAGQHLVDETEASFAHITRALSAARDAVGQARGLLRVTAPVALGRQHVAPCLSAFFKLYPQIRIELDLSDRLVPLAQEGFDLAIRHCSAPPDSHIAVKLCSSRALLVASPAYLQAHGAPLHPQDLAEHACLPYLRPGPALWLFEQAGVREAEPQRLRIPVQGPLRASNSEILRDAALDDLGLALLPDFSAAPALRSGALLEVLPHWRPVGFFGDAIYAVYPWSNQVPRPLKLLIEHLRKSFAKGFA
ncbi:LysR family transcriptional regulator [Paucibacter sp. B2R-40]|jgi:DNA-binding transcriptional LysR family regulator|uniref:LysR family transcriptional regulator n=1 Tax=Paucibacter sp. B2R-40 TaxID=2893554 RepID=UPI0021E480F7|nr:LysR family transcriptional regulator [Paucibacter sp. B2R-40]MCV2352914.1 LysR family transcriptional regulator [Paucibacter sp. B2R-40]